MKKEPDLTKIRSNSEKDLTLFSSLIQDGLCPITAMNFEDGCFSLLVNRFLWEHFHKTGEGMRTHSGLVFKNVLDVKKRGCADERMLNLLALNFEKTKDDYQIRLLFSDRAEIIVHMSELDYSLCDFQEPWATDAIPQHEMAA